MLDSLFEPRAIAVIGASHDPQKVGYAVLNNLLRFHYRGELYPVNPAGGEISGVKAFPRIAHIRRDVDLAVIAVPARFVADALLDCARAGVGAAVIISAGFKESGPEGMKREIELKRIAKEHDIRMLGPNCLGIINTANDMNATFAAGMLPKGRIAFFSQSGALGIAVLDWAIGNDIGFSKFISLGNKTDLNEIDFIEYFVNDPGTDVILGYIEDVVDGKRFLASASKATRTKPIILLKSGGTAAGARAASSHTGALAGSETAFRAAFAQSGIIRADGMQDLFDTALAFAAGRLPRGDKLLIITNAGGPGIIAADASERLGLRLSQMSKETIESLAALLPANASLYNPVDIIGDARSDRYAAVLEKAIPDPLVDGILVILTPQAMVDVENTADIVISSSGKTDKPILTSFMGELRVRDSTEKFKACSIPNYPYPETAVKAFKSLSDYAQWKNLGEEPPQSCSARKEMVHGLIEGFLKEGRFRLGEDDALRILAGYGFTFPKRSLAKTSREASHAASRIGFPVAMKVSSPDILHKTDVGGVKLDIATRKEAEDAFAEITSNVNRLMPDAFVSGVTVYEMVKGGKEVIVGVTFDRTFGHMIMFGLGGIYVEVLKDVSFRIVPVSRREASAMTGEIRTAALLKGARGERPVDTGAVVDGIVRLSCLVSDFPVIHELDINPFVVMEKGAVALDARIILERREAE
ncbi:MAG: acetate--CoA ligase family protein [Nitrospirae bacterium]|nr:acetate--CoA ligase family protein [Nitrospirota bacterium]